MLRVKRKTLVRRRLKSKEDGYWHPRNERNIELEDEKEER